MGRGTNNNQLKAIRGSKRNGGGGGSGDGGKGDINNDSMATVTAMMPTLTLSALPSNQYNKEPS
jgi:hypothetical protein